MMRSWRAMVSLLLLAIACGQPKAEPGVDLMDTQPVSDDAGLGDAGSAGPTCLEDADCLDGLYCNGQERCLPNAPGADARGCLPGAQPCAAESSCKESEARCVRCAEDDDLDDDTVPGVACGGTDCADDDPRRFPGNPELCDDGHDEDCDLATVGARDLDSDGFVDALCRNEGGSAGDDCNDANAHVHPQLDEVCNGIDDNCEGEAPDEGLLSPFYPDLDGDEHGDLPEQGSTVEPVEACGNAAQLADTLSDCDPTNLTVHERQVELCDGLDNDCDGAVDDSPEAVVWYRDADGDGFGDARQGTVVSCTPPAEGWSIVARDCDDTDPDVSPVAPELCDGKDNNCNGRADYRIAVGDYEDDDGDGHVDAACLGLGDDCNDRDYTTYAGAPELCDARDNDCDGKADDGAVPVPWFVDADHDGFGDAQNPVLSCVLLPGRVLRAGDCADDDALRNPGQPDDCAGRESVDDDCDGQADDDAEPAAWYVDLDGDGFGAGLPVLACAQGAGYARDTGDCDEKNAARSPGAPELCADGKDNDCDGLSDCQDSQCFAEPLCAPVAELELLDGAGQSAVMGDVFARPLSVRLADTSGAPLAGRAVTLDALGGSGPSLAGAVVASDGQGVARFTLRAGRKVGTDLVRISARGARPLTVSLEVSEPTAGEVVALLNAEKQAGAADIVLSGPASFAHPASIQAVVAAGDGSLYFGTAGRIHRLTFDGRLEHVAGDPEAPFADGVDARHTAIDPRALALDESDPLDARLYVADRSHARVRVIALRTGTVSTVAGGGSAEGPDYGDGQAATSAQLKTPVQLVLLGRALYVMDSGIQRIRKIDLASGRIEALEPASSPDLSVCSCAHGCELTGGPTGDLFVAARAVGKLVDDPERACSEFSAPVIVRITPEREPVHVAGSRSGTLEDDSAISAALPEGMRALSFDPAGNLYFAAGDARIRRIDAVTRRMTTVLGDGVAENSGDYLSGAPHVTSVAALLFVKDSLVIAESAQATLRLAWQLGQLERSEVNPELTSAPTASASILAPAAPLAVHLEGPSGQALSHAFVEFHSVNEAGYLSAGRALTDQNGDASSTPWLGRAPKPYVYEARFEDLHGRPYHAPLSVERVAEAPLAGTVLPLVNRTRVEQVGELPGPGVHAQIPKPTSVVAASDGTLYIASGVAQSVYRLSPDGYLDVLAGTGVAGNRGDGGPARLAELTWPNALALDEARGRLYVAQYEYEASASPSSRIRVIELGAEPLIDAFVNGLNRIQGLSVGADGQLYVAKESDSYDDGLWRVDPDTRVLTLFVRGTTYEANKIRFYQCYQDCGVAAQDDGSVLVSGMLAGDPFWLPRAPPYGNGIARYTQAGGVDLESVVGRGWNVLSCPADCAGAEGDALSLSIAPARSLTMHDGDLYFLEREKGRVRRLHAGQLTTLMGGGTDASDYVPARAAQLSEPMGLTVTNDGHVIVADFGHNEVRLIW